MKISKRLETIAKIANQYSQNGVLADIGTDHGLLPCYCVKSGKYPYAYACDINQGPLNQAIETISQFGLEHQIETLLGNGLLPIVSKKIDTICICGMGGNLVCEILDAALNQCDFNTLIIQANVNEVLVREWLNKHNYSIIDEYIVEDMKHYYEIIVARVGTQLLSEKELYIGPILLTKKGDEFYKKWKWQLDIHQDILNSLPKDNPKYQRVLKEFEWINEILMMEEKEHVYK